MKHNYKQRVNKDKYFVKSKLKMQIIDLAKQICTGITQMGKLS